MGLGLLAGGIGVFEAVVVGTLRETEGVAETLGGLILFRVIYYLIRLLTLLTAAPILLAQEIGRITGTRE